MEDIALMLKQYGVNGLTLIFCFWLVRYLIIQFTIVIKENTQAFHDLKEAILAIKGSSEYLEKGLDRVVAGNSEIMQYIRMTKG